MIGLYLIAVASAEPPRTEVFAAWSGRADRAYAFATVQPALMRSTDASVVLRATASVMTHTWDDEGSTVRVDSPGISVGPAFVVGIGDLSSSLGVGFGARRPTEVREGLSQSRLVADATIGGDAAWRPGQRAQLYGLFSFSSVDPYLWTRAGASVAVFPWQDTARAVVPWIGLEATNSGTFADRVGEVGPVVELAIRDLRATASVRAAIPVTDVASLDAEAVRARGTLGVGVYWAW